MNNFAMKFAASTVIVSMTMVGCQSDYAMLSSASAWAAAADADKQAAQFNEKARRSLQEGNLSAALDQIEQAVALSPRDAGYRLLLAEVYLKSGRFDSARATFADVLELDPGNTRAGMSYALTQIALGRPAAAVAQLDELAGRAAPADLGLAYALAGYPERGIELIEPVARTLGATARVRQNLALAYALAGDWQRARTIAAQDVSPADLATRMQQWASFTQPSQSWDQVAGLLGVTPAQDPGQPVRLALRQEPVPSVAYAETLPPQAPHEVESRPIQFAQATAAPVSPVYLPSAAPGSFEPEAVADAAPEFEPEPAPTRLQVRYASAARTLVVPEPAVIRAAMADVAPPAPVFERDRPEPRNPIIQPRPRRADPGRYVVQLGAFSNSENAERAWVQAESRFGLKSAQPLTTTIDWDGRVLHRVSIAGFDNRGEATGLCGSIKARGGECFVREIAGDAPIRWAARYVRNA